jgi:hypothetical protein
MVQLLYQIPFMKKGILQVLSASEMKCTIQFVMALKLQL